MERQNSVISKSMMFRLSPHLCQALWLDANEGGVKAAEGVGMKAALVTNLDEILEKISGFTGIQVQRVLGTVLFQIVILKLEASVTSNKDVTQTAFTDNEEVVCLDLGYFKIQ